MQEDSAPSPPPGSIQIDPEIGFGPHLVDAFLNLYGEDSVFVTATVDNLTWRFIGVLIRSGRLPEDTLPPQYGTTEMREALEQLLGALAARGLDRPSTVLMRAALGHEDARAFQSAAGALLGADLVARWLQMLETQDYAGTRALLEVN